MHTQPFFFIRSNRKFERIEHSELAYMESCRGYVKMVTDHKTWMVHCTMQHLEQVLPADKFVRIHRGFIVAVERVLSFDKELVTIRESNHKTVSLPIGQDRYKMALADTVTTVGSEISCRTSSFITH